MTVADEPRRTPPATDVRATGWERGWEAATHGGNAAAPRGCDCGGTMQARIASLFTYVAEMGVFFGAAIALTAGALALR
jgi:hypothetical protein